MRVVVAVEKWGPAHTGSTGTAWWLAHGLAERGHRVEAVTTALLRPGAVPVAGPVVVKLLEASRPPEALVRLALARAPLAGRAATAVQHRILDDLGSTTDATEVDLHGVHGLIAVGWRSPHVRALARRAKGRVPTVVQLGNGDFPPLAMPVLQLETRGHPLVTHWSAIAELLSGRLGRPVTTIPPATGVRSVLSPGQPMPATGATALVVQADRGAPPYSSCDALLRGRGYRVLRRLPAELSTARIDAAVEQSRVVLFSSGDAGDVPALSMAAGRPLIASRHSSAAEEIAASGAGWIADDPDGLGLALAAMAREATQMSERSVAFTRSVRSWDHVAQSYEALIGA